MPESKKTAATFNKSVVTTPPVNDNLVTIELTGGLTYRLLDGTTFFKGKPQKVNRKLADQLLKTGLFKVSK